MNKQRQLSFLTFSAFAFLFLGQVNADEIGLGIDSYPASAPVSAEDDVENTESSLWNELLEWFEPDEGSTEDAR